jgi:hypothetical protein
MQRKWTRGALFAVLACAPCRRWDSPNAYLLRLLWATRAPGKGVPSGENERDLLAALRASPIANFCKDTGDFYAARWQPLAA